MKQTFFQVFIFSASAYAMGVAQANVTDLSLLDKLQDVISTPAPNTGLVQVSTAAAQTESSVKSEPSVKGENSSYRHKKNKARTKTTTKAKEKKSPHRLSKAPGKQKKVKHTVTKVYSAPKREISFCGQKSGKGQFESNPGPTGKEVAIASSCLTSMVKTEG